MVFLVSKDAKIERLQRELHRIRISPSLRLGGHVTDALRKPWRVPFLPITLTWMILLIGMEMLGRRTPPSSYNRVSQDYTLSTRNCIIMFPTNGVGFGHFTRMLAVAKRMKIEDPTLEVIFFTTMPTLHLLKPYGIPAHHISGPKSFDDMSSNEWNTLLEEELLLCIEAHRPNRFIFDGSFPYRGMLRAINQHPGIDKIWMRRGTFRRGASIPIDSIEHFNLIIHPDDCRPLSASEIEHNVEMQKCPPITLLDYDELLQRESARQRLRIPQDVRVVYVQIGAGEINDISSEVSLTLEALTSYEDVHVVLGESMLGDRLETQLPRVHILRDYPNSMYFHAFDATVQAGGYNSFHETRCFGTPALFYPNMNTGMDDQLSRCLIAEEEGWGSVIRERNQHNIRERIVGLLDMIGTVEQPQIESGAWPVARHIISRNIEVVGEDDGT